LADREDGLIASSQGQFDASDFQRQLEYGVSERDILGRTPLSHEEALYIKVEVKRKNLARGINEI
jgi:hypothetical protein